MSLNSPQRDDQDKCFRGLYFSMTDKEPVRTGKGWSVSSSRQLHKTLGCAKTWGFCWKASDALWLWHPTTQVSHPGPRLVLADTSVSVAFLRRCSFSVVRVDLQAGEKHFPLSVGYDILGLAPSRSERCVKLKQIFVDCVGYCLASCVVWADTRLRGKSKKH